MQNKYDVIVVGGGPGGVCAAVGAAREGISPREIGGTRLKAVVLGDALQ